MAGFGAMAAMAVRGWVLDLVVVSSCMVGAFVLGAVVIALVQRWRRQEEQSPTPDAQLGHFRSLYERGEISADEFQKLRATVLGLPTPRAVPQPLDSEGLRLDVPESSPSPEQPSPPPQPLPPPSDGIQPS
jgi:hypothetical protein